MTDGDVSVVQVFFSHSLGELKFTRNKNDESLLVACQEFIQLVYVFIDKFGLLLTALDVLKRTLATVCN